MLGNGPINTPLWQQSDHVFCVGGAEGLYKDTAQKNRVENSSRSEESKFGAPACRDMNLGAEESDWVESSELGQL
jgi:hypothetical protein